MDLSLCPAVYLHSKQLAASGSINLDPGKHYYLIFSNDASIIQAGTEVTSAVVAGFNLLYPIISRDWITTPLGVIKNSAAAIRIRKISPPSSSIAGNVDIIRYIKAYRNMHSHVRYENWPPAVMERYWDGLLVPFS